MISKSKLKPKKVTINLKLNKIIIINYDYDRENFKKYVSILNYKIDNNNILIKHQPDINSLILPIPKKNKNTINKLFNFFNISKYFIK
jgi:hypothetical protein